MLGYLNLGGLIALGESAGLGEDPAYATFASEIHKLRGARPGDPVELRSSSPRTLRLIVGGGARRQRRGSDAGGSARRPS